jgi:hypothetical protein
MTEYEAIAEAQRIYGPRGYAEERPSPIPGTVKCLVGKFIQDGRRRFRVFGMAPTWEAAFERAALSTAKHRVKRRGQRKEAGRRRKAQGTDMKGTP